MDYDIERKSIENQAKEYDIEYLKSILDLTKFGIKAAFTINGATAVALLTLFTNTLINNPDVSSGILNASFIFAIGALFAVITIIPDYFAKINHRKAEWHEKCDDINNLEMMRSNKKFQELINEKTILSTNEKTAINNLNEYQSSAKKLIKINKDKYIKHKIHAICWHICGIIFISLSFLFFFIGIYVTKNSFSTPEEPTPQITMTNSSYPNVEILPILNKH